MATYTEGNIVYEVSLDTKNLLENSGKVREQLLKLNDNGEIAAKGLKKVESSAASAGNSLGKLTTVAKAVSAALVSSQILAYAQGWNELEDRIGNTGATVSQTKDIMDKLLETSNRNGRSIEESSELYIKLSNSMKELGYSTNDTLDYIDTLSNLMTINKTSSMGAESAINALTKAQMKGKLSGVEAMAVFNAMPSILKTLGSQLNKTESEVRSMADSGKLSMQQFSQAMISAQDETAKLADNMRNTVNDGLTRVTNNLKKYLGELNNSTGATGLLVDSLVLVSQHVDILANGLGILAAVYAGKYITSMAAATKQSAEKVIATLQESAATKKLVADELIALETEGRALTVRKQNLLATKAITTSKFQLKGINQQLNAIEAQRTILIDKETAAQARLATATKVSTVAANGLKGAMSMLGGPAGILLIAAGAFMSWSASAEAAREKAINLAIDIGSLTAAYKKMNNIQREAAKVRLSEDIAEQQKQYDKATDKVNEFKQAEADAAAQFNVEGHGERYQNQLKLLLAAQDKIGQALTEQKTTLDNYNKISNEAANATDNLAGSTNVLNEAFSKDATDSITKNIAKLAQETEIAELKQKGLTKQAYIYQGVLSTLGDDAGKYQASLFKAVQSGDLLKGNIEGLPEQVYPLIAALSQLYEVNNDGAGKTSSAASKIKELENNIAVARLEVKGAIADAKELKALQDAKSTNGTQEEINKIVALTKEYENLQAAKEGRTFAKEQVDNGMTDLEKIDNDESIKLDMLNAWRDTGLADEQLYQDAYNAIVEDGAKTRKKIEDDEVAARLANTQAILSSSSDLFGGLADLTKTFSNEQSTAYKAMFAVSKGFAIANAALNLQTAISNASSAPWPTNFAFMAQAAAQGAQIASSISSLSYGGGREHGGSVNANSMYRTGEGGKPEILMSGGRQYMIPGENGKVLSNKDIRSASASNSATALEWTFIVENNVGNAQIGQPDIDRDKRIVKWAVSEVANGIQNHSGEVWNAMKNSTNIKAKL
ncbi:tape measure protein [Orbus sturtevantii]|uniref:tape measure protein n=1 Tax=Orbus sturtevantii TaxID=3074109 RepID=UPI00370D2E96